MFTDDRSAHYIEVADYHLLFTLRDSVAAVLRWCCADLRIAPPTLRFFRRASEREITGRAPGIFVEKPKLAGRAHRKSWTIDVRSDLSMQEMRLTTAHELRHLSLGVILAPDFDAESDCERYARRALDAVSWGLRPGAVAPVMSAPAPDTARRPSAAPLAAPGRSGSPASYSGQPSPPKAAYVPGRPLDPAAIARRYNVPLRSDGRLDLAAYARQRQALERAAVEWR